VPIAKLEFQAMLRSENYSLVAPSFLGSGEETGKKKGCFIASGDILGNLVSFFLKIY